MKKKKFYILTIGCAMNISDSERIAGKMIELGFEETSKRSLADFVFINTCGVRQSPEDRVYMLVQVIKKINKKAKIILTGCLSERKDVIRRLEDRVDIWLPIKQMPKLGTKLGVKKNH
jgi:tRNA A37 methylthiotransferase MiaB